MIIKKSSITVNNKLNIGYKLTDWPTSFPYPISSIKELNVKGSFIKDRNNDIEMNIHIKGNIDVRDSRDDVIFPYPINLSESCLLFELDDGEKEGYIVEGDEIDLNNLVIRLIISSFPMRITREGSKLPKNGDGFTFSTDSEEETEKPLNSAFDKLKDFKF